MISAGSGGGAAAEIALESLFHLKFRTFLSVLGVIIGVAAVVIIGSITTSGKRAIFDELSSFGLKSVWFWAYHPPQLKNNPKTQAALDMRDFESLTKKNHLIRNFTPVINRDNIVCSFGSEQIKARLVCANDRYTIINNDKILFGRPLLADDGSNKRKVCLIGEEVRKELFQNRNPLGKQIRVLSTWFTVVGVLERKSRLFVNSIGGSSTLTVNRRVVIPIDVYHSIYNNRDIDYIFAEAVSVPVAVEAALEMIRHFRGRTGDRLVYKVETMGRYVAVAEKILSTVSWVGNIAAALSLLVGGIGIMNIMTASVVERTREIGIRKALGASKRDILLQFLAESAVISVIGGVIGMAFAALTVHVLEIFIARQLSLSVFYAIVSLVICLATGLFSGIYPAMKAARMDPVDALR